MVMLSLASECTSKLCAPAGRFTMQYVPLPSLHSSTPFSRTLKRTPPPTNFFSRKNTTVPASPDGAAIGAALPEDVTAAAAEGAVYCVYEAGVARAEPVGTWL